MIFPLPAASQPEEITTGTLRPTRWHRPPVSTGTVSWESASNRGFASDTCEKMFILWKK